MTTANKELIAKSKLEIIALNNLVNEYEKDMEAAKRLNFLDLLDEFEILTNEALDELECEEEILRILLSEEEIP